VELASAKVLIAGAGAVGAASAAHLAAAGAGYLAIADGTAEDGFNRAELLAARLAPLVRALHVDPYPVEVDEANAVAIATGHDLILDATSERAPGLLLAGAGARLGVPVVHAARAGVSGHVLATARLGSPDAAEAVLRTVSLPPEIRSIAVERDPGCAVCAPVAEAVS
jgi:adenylyltransferase/sulfurtransferase